MKIICEHCGTSIDLDKDKICPNCKAPYSKNQDYKQQEAELESQIKKEEERSKEIKEYQDYVKTDDYIREVAEDKLGLVDPNEILFKQTN